MRRCLRALLLLVCVPAAAAAQSTRDDGILAFAAGNYSKAAEILRPLAEGTQPPDHAAAFVMALLYSSGRGISPNPVAACGLFSTAAATRGAFARQAGFLANALRSEMGRAAQFCAGDAWQALSGPSNVPARPNGLPSAAGPGWIAAAHDDMTEAVRIAHDAGESDCVDDPAARFLMAVAYESGQGVPQDDLRACALYERASNDQQTPFGELSSRLMRALWQAHDTPWFNQCQALSFVGFDHRFEPVTLALDLGYDVAWDFTGATITYHGASKRFPLPLASRGAVFLPLIHTTLYTGRAHTKRDFVSLLLWQRVENRWNLSWRLFEVTPTNIRGVGAESLATRGERPPPGDPIDPNTMIAVRVNEHGIAEWAVLDPAHPRAEAIESEDDLRAARDEQAARRARLARVDYSARYDVSRLPSLRYIAEDGCSRFTVVGFSEDRAEAVEIRVDQEALGLKTGPATIDLARAGTHVSVTVYVFDRPLGASPFCTDVGTGEPLSRAAWHAVGGVLTIDLAPPGVMPRDRGLSRATVRLDGAEFVNASGTRIRQTAAIVLSALVGTIFG